MVIGLYLINKNVVNIMQWCVLHLLDYCMFDSNSTNPKSNFYSSGFVIRGRETQLLVGRKLFFNFAL